MRDFRFPGFPRRMWRFAVGIVDVCSIVLGGLGHEWSVTIDFENQPS